MKRTHAWGCTVLACLLAGCSASTGGPPSGPRPGTDSGPGGGGGGVDAGSGGGGGRRDGGGGGGGGGSETCDEITVGSEPGLVNALIVLDRSGSMYEVDGLFGEVLVDRWTPAVGAINAFTMNLEDQVRFGLLLFPEIADSTSCQPATGRFALPPASGAAAEIRDELSGRPEFLVGGGTPTAETLVTAGEMLAEADGDGYVVLITDGAPNCNVRLNPNTCVCTNPPCFSGDNCLDDANSVAAVEALASAGIRTFVIGYDAADLAPAFRNTLTSMAQAGGTGRDDYFNVSDQTSLEAAFDAIGGSVISCTHQLNDPVSDVRYVRVTVDGETVGHTSTAGDGSGWELQGDRTIEILGDDCDALRDGGAHDVNIVVECEPIII